MATVDEISTIILVRIEQYHREVKIVNTVGDGIARLHGLDEVMAGELVEFDKGTISIALNLESNYLSVVLMGDCLLIQERSSVIALAKPIDGITSRCSVYKPLQTGLIAIDSMIPIGRGE
ncbi:hypothetical protein MIMGU_mgv11b017912mg [Erythranthe guttata]|uniref:ATPase F1/V1/A1 complex alpha/beta subunit N-terminal domain-containing protein n=1 Tax=Erythranthe guttata TaxID=4155 RepID=A0A022RH69_ERYGU|nr:hypothetical protein MIMGU_mgv11b017912mg [Erythranthe guttata]